MGHPEAPAWAHWLESSGLGETMRSSAWLFPTANVLHVLAVILLVGPIVALDLRLLGLARRLEALPLERYLTGFAKLALPVILATGVALFAADATHTAENPAFWVKMGLLVLALANALLFRRRWQRTLPEWDSRAPAAARLQALASLLLWPATAASGRLLAYF